MVSLSKDELRGREETLPSFNRLRMRHGSILLLGSRTRPDKDFTIATNRLPEGRC